MMLTSRPNKHIVKLSLLYPPFYSSPMANTSNDLWGLLTKIFVLGSYIFINIQFKDPTQHTKCSVNEWWVQWKALWVLWKALYKSNPALLFIIIIHFAFLRFIFQALNDMFTSKRVMPWPLLFSQIHSFFPIICFLICLSQHKGSHIVLHSNPVTMLMRPNNKLNCCRAIN